MLLCEQYALRKGLGFCGVLHVTKGFVFFGDVPNLLVIRWERRGSHPGFYEISECVLDQKIRSINHKNISWEEYEDYILNWAAGKNILFNSDMVFDLAWQFFIRKNDKFLSENYDPFEICATLDAKNPQRFTNSMCFLEKLSIRHPHIADFWKSKASDIVNHYSYWLKWLQKYK